MKLSVLVPVYNEAATVAAAMKRVLDVDYPCDVEVVMVDDGSVDGTAAILDALDDPRATVVHHPVNRGKGAAIRAGLELVTGDLVIIQDADLELDPSEYPKLVQPILAGATRVVYGTRFAGRITGVPLVSLWANRFLTFLTNLLYGARLTDMETCYKVFRSDVIKGIRLECQRFEFEPEVTAKLLRLGHTILEVPISFTPRSRAEGKKLRWRDGVQAIHYLLRYRLASRASLLRSP